MKRPKCPSLTPFAKLLYVTLRSIPTTSPKSQPTPKWLSYFFSSSLSFSFSTIFTTVSTFAHRLTLVLVLWSRNLCDIKPVWFRCFAEWAQSYGTIISVWFGSTLNVIVSSSELATQVLKEKDQQSGDRHRSRFAAKFIRDGKDLIWCDYRPHYVKVRKVCTLELFSPKRLEALRPIREGEVTAMVGLFTTTVVLHILLGNLGEKSLVLRKYLGAVAFNNITRLAFGKRFVNSQGTIDKQGHEFKAVIANGLKLMHPLLWLSIFHDFVGCYHWTKRRFPNMENDMTTAGIDTTAISVEWAMAELIKNLRVQRKAQEELDSVIGHERVMTELDFSNLLYLQCISKEALRLHPPTPLMLPHRANTNVKVGGYDIPKGSNLHFNVWAVARDPKVWRNGSKFRPERFLEEDVDMKGHVYRLLPFGAGGRVCSGA
ncbi:hypothetical protein OROGR_014127 [Orobanche gracilis]